MITKIETTHALSQTQWTDVLFKEYLGQTWSKPYMGTDKNSLIYVNEDLTKEKSDTIKVGLRAALSGNGVEGDAQLEGNEELMTFHDQAVVIDELRHAVAYDNHMSQQRLAYNIRENAKEALTDWWSKKIDSRVASGFSNFNGTAYAAASEAVRDAWLVANSDRVVFGNSQASAGYTDHSTDVALVDATNDVLKAATISFAKRKAKMANPRIRPIKIQNGMEFFVMFVHPYALRDLLNESSSPITQAQRDLWARIGDQAPMFQGQNKVMWDGVMVVECEDILIRPDEGSSGSCDVACNVLCGAQALTFALGGYNGGAQRVGYWEETFDYEKQIGIGMGQIFNVTEAMFNSKMHGMVRVYTAGVADA